MSRSNDEGMLGDTWVSLAAILYERKISVGDLTTVIEKVGVKTYDRVDRPITATDGGDDELTSKSRALTLLASYYAEISAARDLPIGQQPSSDPHQWLEGHSPLCKFGWLKRDVPDFAEVIADKCVGTIPGTGGPQPLLM